MTVITVQMFQGPLNYPPGAKNIYFTPATNQVLITIAGSGSCIAPPDYMGVKPILNSKAIDDPTAPGGFASARIYDDATPNRQTFVPLTVIAPVLKAQENLLTLLPMTVSTATDANDVFTVTIYDVGS